MSEDGIVAPDDVVEDLDDELVLADSSGGSIADQLRANTASTVDTGDLRLADDLDDLDDLDVD